MPLPAQLQLSNTFGQWLNTTNLIITSVGNTSEYLLVAQNATPATSTGNVSVNGTITVVNLTSNGTITGNNLSLTNSLLEKYSSTLTYTVTVINKTAAHRYFGTGSGHGYVINGFESPYLSLLPGKTYRFDQSDASNAGHPLRFYVDEDKSKQYTTDITTSGTAGESGYTEIVVTANTPATLHYQCSSHAKMGNQIQVEGSRAFDLILAYGNVTANGVLTIGNVASLGNTTVTGFVNVSSNVSIGNVTMNTTNVSIGANVIANTTTVFVGNSSVNTAITAGAITLSGVAVGTNASALSTGTVPLARLDANVILTTSTTGINASALSTGTVPLARLSSANTTANGVVDTTTQTFAGDKTFQNAASFSNTVSITGAANALSTLGVSGTLNALGQLSAAGNAAFGQDVTITGNLTVSGTTTYINTTNLQIGDNLITLNADLPGGTAPSEHAGVEINRGSSANVALRWNETSDVWQVTEDGTNYGTVLTTISTTGINASALSTGTMPLARLDSNVILTTSTTGINASALSTGTVPLARLSSANTTANGVVDTTTQSFAGDKTFTNNVAVSGTLSLGSNVVVNTSTVFVGNSTINVAMTSTPTFNGNTTTGVTANCKVTLNTTNGRFVLPVGVDKWSPS